MRQIFNRKTGNNHSIGYFYLENLRYLSLGLRKTAHGLFRGFLNHLITIRITVLTLLITLLHTSALALGEDKLLKPDAAFKGSIVDVTPTHIIANWNIADGYYMYRKRFQFDIEQAGVQLSKAIFPKGKMKNDPGFGNVEVYRHQVEIKIPYHNASTTDNLVLKTKSQGCADLGVCYPPQKKAFKIILAKAGIPSDNPLQLTKTDALPDLTPDQKSNNLAEQLGITTLGNVSKPLHPDEAFALDITAKDQQTLNAHFRVTPGHYLYQHKLAFEIIDNPAMTLPKPNLPQGKPEHDQYFGDIVIYEKDFEVPLPLQGKTSNITVKTSYQGCSKLTGICYPPQHKTQTINLTSAPIATVQNATTVNTAPKTNITQQANSQSGEKVSEQDSIVNRLKSGNFLATLIFFLLAGLALTFTPCVFPMIPILSGIIAGQGEDNNVRKSFFLSLAYVIPMALTYAIVGVIAALTGENLQVALQNPWVIAAFAGLFVLLSLAMFGFYELQMPASIQNKLSNISNSREGGSLINAGIMGVLSALIVGPCVTAPLIGALIYIAQTKDVVLGGLSLFSLGLGMGIPLLIIGTSAGKVLPRAGAWMDKVKAAFGILMLALAIWMLERILPISVIMLLTGALAIFSGIYLGAFDTLSETSTGWKRFFKASGLLTFILGVLLVIGFASGSNNILQPLKGIYASGTAGTASQSQSLQFMQIKGIDGLNDALKLAKQNNQPVMFDFYADWCITCKEMEHNVFTKPDIINALSDTLLIQADVTKNDELDKALLEKFGLFGPPAILFFDTNSTENKNYRVVGYMKAPDFLSHIKEYFATL